LAALFITCNSRFCGNGATYRGGREKHFKRATYIKNIRVMLTCALKAHDNYPNKKKLVLNNPKKLMFLYYISK
jgi:hypothetical protein